MAAPGETGRSELDGDAPTLGRSEPPPGNAAGPKHASLVSRVVPVVLILVALAAATAVALGSGTVALPGRGVATASGQQAAATTQMAANQRWASATCTNVVDWKNEVQHDLHGLTLSLEAIPRVQAAIGATTRMLDSIDKRALPPALQSSEGRALVAQLRADIQSRAHGVESAVSSVAAGNIGAIGTLLSDLGNIPSIESQVAGRLRDAASELGVSMASSPSCRQLVGVKL